MGAGVALTRLCAFKQHVLLWNMLDDIVEAVDTVRAFSWNGFQIDMSCVISQNTFRV